jgi:leucine-rich repeat/coiled-coil domain-containing protein 1
MVLIFIGSSLAQNRGKLEAQIESLCRENESLKKATENDKDTLRVKSKIMEDQTETIRKLKSVSLTFYFEKRANTSLKICESKYLKNNFSACFPTVVEFKT